VRGSLRRAAALAVALMAVGPIKAQVWKLKDSGVGLVTQDADYDKILKIVQRGKVWDFEELYAKGAFSNRPDTDGFCAWLVGPPVDSFLDKYGLPIWNYRYVLTYPDGSTYQGGPGGFYAPGFAVVGISLGAKPDGKWKIEWFIVNRATKEERLVAVDEFTSTWGKPAALTWKLRDSGVGLVTQDADYDKVLKIAQRGDKWDFKELYAKGAFANKYDGNKGFCAWLVGPPVDSFLDENGLPIWNYRYVITYPDGSIYQGGPGGFYAPGFTVVAIGPGAKPDGKWKIEWFIVNRTTKESVPVALDEFVATW